MHSKTYHNMTEGMFRLLRNSRNDLCDLNVIHIHRSNLIPSSWHNLFTDFDFDFLFGLIRGNENTILINESYLYEDYKKSMDWVKYVLHHVWWEGSLDTVGGIPYGSVKFTPDQSDSVYRGQFKAISDSNKLKLKYLKQFATLSKNPNIKIHIETL